MVTFDQISTLKDFILNMPSGTDKKIYHSILNDNTEEIALLKLLEKTSPASQRYHLYKHVIFITFKQKKSFLTLGKTALSIGVTFIGFPLSISKSGYLLSKNMILSNLPEIIRDFAKTQKGTVVVLNSQMDIYKGLLTESVFTFYHDFATFEEYIGATRSSYHKKISQSLKKGKSLKFCKISPDQFTEEHYSLYLSVNERMKQKLITMPLEYFRTCDAVIFEIRDENQLLAFVQLKEINGTLYFILGGFRKNEEEYAYTLPLSHIDLYYNMLLLVIRYGIEHHYRKVVLGQTAAESKSKLGAREELSYLYVTSSSPFVRGFLALFPKLYSFEPYGVNHKVFKEASISESPIPEETLA